MSFDAAIIKEQGVTFTVVTVKRGTIRSPQVNSTINSFASRFPSPIILMEQDSRGTPEYYGRKDIVKFLSNINPSRFPWKRYS